MRWHGLPNYIYRYCWRLVIIFSLFKTFLGGKDGVVSIAIRHGLDGPTFEPRCMRDFPYPQRRTPKSTQPNVQWVPCLFPGAKEAGRWL
jgi:hypothetical protein